MIKTCKTVAETEEALGVKRDTVYRLLRAGELERVHLLKVVEADQLLIFL